jgi:hypothetical protein
MSKKGHSSTDTMNSKQNNGRLDRVVADAIKEKEKRELGYREQSLKIHPWVCARCGREFTRKNLQELTVHHKDHNHDNNPADGSNWENLCIYCHDNEHQRYLDHLASDRNTTVTKQGEVSTYKPFASLKDIMKDKKV